MSERYTISVYLQGRIADNSYYRNWNVNDLFYEAVVIAALYEDCRTVEEYRQKKYGRQRVYYIIEPELIENTDENLKCLESCSEFPLVVDLTARCIYKSYGGLSPEEIEKLPHFREDVIGYRTSKKEYWRPGTSYEKAFQAKDYKEYCRKNRIYKEVQEEIPGYREIGPSTDFWDMLKYCRIPFDDIDLQGILRFMENWPEAKYHLSKNLIESLKKAGKNIGGTDESF